MIGPKKGKSDKMRSAKGKPSVAICGNRSVSVASLRHIAYSRWDWTHVRNELRAV